jgi:hypothetical protein
VGLGAMNVGREHAPESMIVGQGGALLRAGRSISASRNTYSTAATAAGPNRHAGSAVVNVLSRQLFCVQTPLTSTASRLRLPSKLLNRNVLFTDVASTRMPFSTSMPAMPVL